VGSGFSRIRGDSPAGFARPPSDGALVLLGRVHVQARALVVRVHVHDTAPARPDDGPRAGLDGCGPQRRRTPRARTPPGGRGARASAAAPPAPASSSTPRSTGARSRAARTGDRPGPRGRPPRPGDRRPRARRAATSTAQVRGPGCRPRARRGRRRAGPPRARRGSPRRAPRHHHHVVRAGLGQGADDVREERLAAEIEQRLGAPHAGGRAAAEDEGREKHGAWCLVRCLVKWGRDEFQILPT